MYPESACTGSLDRNKNRLDESFDFFCLLVVPFNLKALVNLMVLVL